MRFHTEAIMTGRRPSKWLENYRNPKGDLVMSYIEDEGDVDLVFGYLNGLLQKTKSNLPWMFSCQRPL
ncbi:hypothetical protein SRHO_G00340640 [Serrasalmus rhombeus]